MKLPQNSNLNFVIFTPSLQQVLMPLEHEGGREGGICSGMVGGDGGPQEIKEKN